MSFLQFMGAWLLTLFLLLLLMRINTQGDTILRLRRRIKRLEKRADPKLDGGPTV